MLRQLAVIVSGLLVVNAVSAQTIPVLRYTLSDTTAMPAIADQTGAGNDATAGPLALLSDDVPTAGVPSDAGNRSLDSSDPTAVIGTASGAVTDNPLLLSNPSIANAGGFTLECWFKWNGGGIVNSVIDYAGTEKIVVDQGLAGANGEVWFRLDISGDILAGVATPGEWHYIAVVFDTGGAALNPDGSVTGTLVTYFDGLTPSAPTTDVTKGTFGDSLVRGIGFGMHPLGFDADFLDGRTFEPRVTLGTLGPDELLFGVAGDPFIRGDANSDDTVDISDAVFMLAALFLPGAPAPTCAKSADGNDDGVFDISDAVYSLASLFIPGSPPPPPPHPDCGVDPTPDAMDCLEFLPCP